MTITVNGKADELPSGSMLTDLLQGLNIEPQSSRGIAVAVNDEVIRREKWQDVILKEGDRIEVVTAKQGG